MNEPEPIPVTRTIFPGMFQFSAIPPRRAVLHKPFSVRTPDGNFAVVYSFTILRDPPESPGLAAYVDAVLGNG